MIAFCLWAWSHEAGVHLMGFPSPRLHRRAPSHPQPPIGFQTSRLRPRVETPVTCDPLTFPVNTTKPRPAQRPPESSPPMAQLSSGTTHSVAHNLSLVAHDWGVSFVSAIRCLARPPFSLSLRVAMKFAILARIGNLTIVTIVGTHGRLCGAQASPCDKTV